MQDASGGSNNSDNRTDSGGSLKSLTSSVSLELLTHQFDRFIGSGVFNLNAKNSVLVFDRTQNLQKCYIMLVVVILKSMIFSFCFNFRLQKYAPNFVKDLRYSVKNGNQ